MPFYCRRRRRRRHIPTSVEADKKNIAQNLSKIIENDFIVFLHFFLQAFVSLANFCSIHFCYMFFFIRVLVIINITIVVFVVAARSILYAITKRKYSGNHNSDVYAY